VSGDYVGVPFGEGNDLWLYSKVSGFGPAFLPLTSNVGTSELFKRPQTVMTASESLFLQAEAVESNLLTSNRTAQELYEMGITESFKLLDVEDAEATAEAYYTSGEDNKDWTASTSKLEAIGTQKWIALAGFSGFEAWTEYRRTGYPTGIPNSTKAPGKPKPLRLLYPLSEYSNNAANTQDQGTISQYTSKIFWMN